MHFSSFKKVTAILLAILLISSIIPIGTITSSAASTGNTSTYFDKLSTYISTYGSTSSDGYKTIVKTSTSSNYTYYYALQKRSSGIYFDLLTTSKQSTYIGTNTEFILYKNSSTISVDFSMLYYYYGNCRDAVSGTKSISRATYTPNTTYSLYKSGTYITSSDFSKTFNNSLELLCTYWDTHLYSYCGFGLEEIGFLNFPGKGSPVCDTVTSYHTGNSVIKNARESTCSSYGYTGDTHCSTCNAKISSGTTIYTYGEHSYDNACDAICNECSFTRVVYGHEYSNNCDATCNNCYAEREVEHTFSTSCDESCDICGAIRETTHSYTTSVTKATLSKNGNKTVKCTVCNKIESDVTIESVKSITLSSTIYAYNGKVKTPAVTIKDSAGKSLKKNTDYTVTYASSRKNVGKYKVTVNLKGDYSGTKNLYFTVNPASTKISKITAGKKNLKVYFTKKTTQTNGYQIQYATNNSFKSAKTKTISSNSKSYYTISGLKLTNYYVRIRTYKTVGGKKYYSDWSSTKIKCPAHTHTYSKATCAKAKTCKICKITSGKPLGHKKGSVNCSRCGKVLFKKLTYTGTGIKKITNINLPNGDFILKMVATATNEDVIKNCFVRLYNGGKSYTSAYTSGTISAPHDRWTISDDDVFEGPIKNGVIKIETSDEVKWTITITPY